MVIKLFFLHSLKRSLLIYTLFNIFRKDFIKLLRENRTIIVRGQPGCGKSTRIPQYVLEGWATQDASLGKPGLIAVTQPRRIAAISLAERVAKEREELVSSVCINRQCLSTSNMCLKFSKKSYII